MDTVVIEIRADYRDNTKGMSKSIDGMDKFSRSVDKTRQQMEKASTTTDNWYDKIKRMANKVISIPVKIVDYATRPLRSLYNFATSLKGVLTGIFVGQIGRNLISNPINLADAYSGARIGFETLFQSAEKAKKMMDEIDEFAIRTPFNTSNVISNIQKMMAYGWDASRMLSDMEIIGNAAAATGKGDEGLGSIVYALSEIRSKGKLSTQELNQLASAGIKAKQYLAEGLGFGTDDAGMMKLSKALEKGLVGANQAIDLILEGMKEFDGMMDLTATETASGLKSQLADVFEVNVARKWGQGLQDGAKRGLGAIATFLDENRPKLEAFGDELYGIGETLSNFVADRAKTALNRLLEVTNSAEFKGADLLGKSKLVWNEVVAEPFNAWWNGEGGAQFREKAEEIGTTIGEWIGKGLAKAFSSIIPGMASNAAKLIPGGASPDASSWMSAAMLAYGAKGLGLGKVAGWGLGKIGVGTAAAGAAGATGSAAATGGISAGAIGMGASTAAGIALGGLGLVSAINDFISSSKAVTDAARHEYNTRGVSKAAMVAIGTGIGTIIAPGIGTAIGAAIGGGAALLGGNAVGSWISGEIRGTNKYKRTAKDIEEAADEFEKASQETEAFNSELDRLKKINAVMEIAQAPDSVKLKTLQDMKVALKEIDGQKAALEVKKKEGSISDEELSELQRLQTEGIIIKATVNGADLGEDDIAAIEERLTNLNGMELDIYAKLANGEGDPNSLRGQLDAIERETLTLNAIVNPTVDNIADAWLKIEEDGVKLEAKLDTAATKEEVAAIKKDIEANEQYKLMLKASIQNFDEAELTAFKQEIADTTQSLIDASNGLLSAWELTHGALDETIEEAEKVSEAKEEETRLKRNELAADVAKGILELPELERRMQEIEQESAGYISGKDERNQAMYETADLIADVRTEAAANGGELDVHRKIYYEDQFMKLWEKYGHTGIYDSNGTVGNLIDFGNDGQLATGSWKRIWGDGGLFGLRTGLIEGMEKNLADYEASGKEYDEQYAEVYDPYKTTMVKQRELMFANHEGKYGGTKDELVQGVAQGDINAVYGLLQMIRDINANESYSYLNPEDKYNASEVIQPIYDAMPNWIAAQFAGLSLVDGSSIEGMIYNAMVEKGNTLVTPESQIVGKEALFLKDESGQYSGEVRTSEEIAKLDEETIKSVQEGLKALGYTLENFEIDGKWGPKSQAAYAKFEEDYKTSGKTAEEFGVKDRTVTDFVKAVQSMLGVGGTGGKNIGFEQALGSTTASGGIYDIIGPSVQNFVDNGLQPDTLNGATTTMSDGLNAAGTNAGAAATGMENAGASAGVLSDNSGIAAGNILNFGGASVTSMEEVASLGTQSSLSSGNVNALGTESGTTASSVADFGAGADSATSKMFTASAWGSLAGINMLRTAANTGAAATAIAEKARQIANISVPSSVGAPRMAEGGVLTGPEFVLAGEDGDEAIIPLSRKHRRRGMALFKEAAKRMGIPMMAKGGIVGDSSENAVNAIVSAPSGGISVSLGGMNFTIQAGSGDAESILAALRSNMPSVANEVANAIAAALEQTYSNMATTGV